MITFPKFNTYFLTKTAIILCVLLEKILSKFPHGVLHQSLMKVFIPCYKWWKLRVSQSVRLQSITRCASIMSVYKRLIIAALYHQKRAESLIEMKKSLKMTFVKGKKELFIELVSQIENIKGKTAFWLLFSLKKLWSRFSRNCIFFPGVDDISKIIHSDQHKI